MGEKREERRERGESEGREECEREHSHVRGEPPPPPSCQGWWRTRVFWRLRAECVIGADEVEGIGRGGQSFLQVLAARSHQEGRGNRGHPLAP